MVDTETCGGLDNPYVYDLGMAIVDRKGKVYAKYSFVIAEVFYGMADLMQTAYYAEKIPMYKEDIKNGKRKLKRLFNIRKELIIIPAALGNDAGMYGCVKMLLD